MISFFAILLRLGLALLLGAIVGWERERREHTAGLRTNALVALGSSLFTIISAFGFTSMLGLPHVQLDPTRVASYVVAGIGFLGGGAIFVGQEKDRVKGLTTAAAVWIVAAIGMACGAGLLLEAVAATIMVLIVLILLRFLERRLLPHRPHLTCSLQIEATSAIEQLVSSVYVTCDRSNITISRLNIDTDREGETIKVTGLVQDASQLASTVGELRALSGVRAVHADLLGRNRRSTSLEGRKAESAEPDE